MEILEKLIEKKVITDEDIEDELYEMCEREHSSCNNGCLMFAMNNEVPNTARNWEENRGCDYFKNGAKMLKALRKEIEK